MNHLLTIVRSWRLPAALAFLGACGSDLTCVPVPCAQPFAITITITSAASGSPVANAVVHVTGAWEGTAPCTGGTCGLTGTAGTYSLQISAPGFLTASRTVSVDGSTPDCGCSTVNTAHVDVALVAGP